MKEQGKLLGHIHVDTTVPEAYLCLHNKGSRIYTDWGRGFLQTHNQERGFLLSKKYIEWEDGSEW
jgi:hypothetical protein